MGQSLHIWLEGRDSAGPALIPGEGDVGVERAGFRDEAAWTGCGYDPLLKSDEFGCNPHPREENASSIEEAETFDPDGNWRCNEDRKIVRQANVLRLVRGAKKLQCDVPRLGAGPTEAVARPFEPRAKAGELSGHCRCERNGDKQAHAIRTCSCGGPRVTKKRREGEHLRASPAQGELPCRPIAVQSANGRGNREEASA